MIDEFGLKPDTHFYNRMLNVLVDGNNLKLVEIAHAKMNVWEVNPDVSTFNVLIKALCRAHQLRPAILMMEDMQSYGLVPDEKTYTTIMQGYIEEGDLDGALRIREQMVEFGCSWSNVSVNVIVHGFCKEGRVEDALNFIQEMSNGGGFFPDQYTFNTLVNGLCKAGHVKHALEIMDVMLQEGYDPDVYTYNSVRIRIRNKELGIINEEQEHELPNFPSFIPFLPPLTAANLKVYYATCFSLIVGIILFGGLLAPTLELKLGIGGTSYADFIQSLHLPMQLSQVDPIMASFSGGAVGVISAFKL